MFLTLLYKETSNLLKYKFIIIKNLYDAIASMKNVRSITPFINILCLIPYIVFRGEGIEDKRWILYYRILRKVSKLGIGEFSMKTLIIENKHEEIILQVVFDYTLVVASSVIIYHIPSQICRTELMDDGKSLGLLRKDNRRSLYIVYYFCLYIKRCLHHKNNLKTGLWLLRIQIEIKYLYLQYFRKFNKICDLLILYNRSLLIIISKKKNKVDIKGVSLRTPDLNC
ncbi:hypothetical protein AGLY_010327 [Aphis glycines]|uniref:Uncharacterized protein n=1 Tax=Aphis glycines TaxID=307491 RepID=A0A6G0TG29_APHGL|nr:hypothetical protein AGLY_010327 [Aphis glycines]